MNSKDLAGITRRTLLWTAASGSCALISMAQSSDQQKSVTDALTKFGDRSRQLLLTSVTDKSFRGKIPAATVRELLQLEKRTPDDLMLGLLPLARTCARPPLSNYFAAAVVLGTSGNLYLGANIEVTGQSLGLTVHAEQASLANAYMSGEGAVTAIAVTAAPCGHCRQFLYEMSPEGAIRVVLNGAPATKLSTLLPMAFGPRDMGFKQGALPITRHGLSLTTQSTDPLILAALDAAQQAYSPYTLSFSGIAIATRDSRVFTGSYIENAAFNPSLPPLETALAGLFAAQKVPADLVRAILVEAASSKISQESATRAALSSLAPGAKVEVLRARG